MVTVAVGSKNPVKIEAVKEVFLRYFKEVEIVSEEVDSTVPKQPIDFEVFEGAINRAKQLMKKVEADFYVGIEGGIFKMHDNNYYVGGVCAIFDRNGRMGIGISGLFRIPNNILSRLLVGEELGKVMEEISGIENIKQKDGAVGFLTKGFINRKELYVHAVTFALIPFINKELFSSEF